MEIKNNGSVSSVLEELGRRLMQARLGRGIKQEGLAVSAGVSKRTVERVEAGHSVQVSNFVRILSALGLAENFERLLAADAPSPLEQLKLRGKVRRRVRSRAAPTEGAMGWRWGEEK